MVAPAVGAGEIVQSSNDCTACQRDGRLHPARPSEGHTRERERETEAKRRCERQSSKPGDGRYGVQIRPHPPRSLDWLARSGLVWGTVSRLSKSSKQEICSVCGDTLAPLNRDAIRNSGTSADSAGSSLPSGIARRRRRGRRRPCTQEWQGREDCKRE